LVGSYYSVNIPIEVVHIPVHLVLNSGCSQLVALL
jgi:hypothetical protein